MRRLTAISLVTMALFACTPSQPPPAQPKPPEPPEKPPLPTARTTALDGQMITQIYVDSIRGDWEDHCKRFCEKLSREGFTRVMFHDFPRRMLQRWNKYRRIARDEGLTPQASWGLDGKRDTDGTRLTAREKGECVGDILRPENGCEAGTLDQEGQWDTDQGPEDDMDERGAIDLGLALRAIAPGAIVMDQPWPWIDMHGDIRRTARPNLQGGVFAGFPVDETAMYAVNSYRARQNYYLNWSPDACFRVTGEMEKQWAPVQHALEPRGLARPLTVTLQAYKHQRLHHLAWCILRYAGEQNAPVIMWSMPFPEPDVLAVMVACERLKREGFAGVGISPRKAVRDWQQAHNRTAPTDKQLAVDGWLGRDSLRAMGLLT